MSASAIMNFIDQDLVSLFVDAGLKAAIVLLIATLAVRCLRRSSASVRHRVWALGLGGALLVPVLTLTLPRLRIPILPAAAAVHFPVEPALIGASGSGASVQRPSRSGGIAASSSDLIGSDGVGGPAESWPVAEATEESLRVGASPPALAHGGESPFPRMATEQQSSEATPLAAAPSRSSRYRAFVLGMWGLGWTVVTLPVLLGLAANAWLLRRSRRIEDEASSDLIARLSSKLGLRRQVTAFEACDLVVPMTWGVLRPVVLLPQNWRQWPQRQRECVLLHELAHVHRLDILFQLLGRFAAAIHWVNPLAWYALRQLRIERELACDDCVIGAGERASDYAQELVQIARTYRPHRLAVGVAMAHSARLDQRVQAILDEARSHLPISPRMAGLFIVVATLLVTGIVSVRPVARSARAGQSDSSSTSSEQVAASPDDSGAAKTPAEVSVTGKVLRPDGTPAAGATVRAAVGVWAPLKPFLGEDYETPMSTTTTDDLGRFTIKITTKPFGDISGLARRWQELWKRTAIAASADGYGPAWALYESVDPKQPLNLKLVKDLPVRGRVVDLEGQPVAGAKIGVSGPQAADGDQDLSAWLESIQAGEPPWTAYKKASRSIDPRLAGTPQQLVSGPDGSFEIRGLGRERIVGLVFEGENVARRGVSVVTRAMEPIEKVITPNSPETEPVYGANFTFTAAPSRPIEGTVVDAETGKPLGGVRVESYKMAGYPFSNYRVLKTVTDEAGHFRLLGMPKAAGNRLLVLPADDQPYFMRRQAVPDPAGLEPVELTIQLHRGIWITGRVTDRVTGEPVPAARLHYLPMRTNEFAAALPEFDDSGNVDGDQTRYTTGADGTFRLVGLPGPAIVGAESTLKTYRYGVGYEEIDLPKVGRSGMLQTYRNPVNPSPKWPHAMLEINPPADAESVSLDFELDPGDSLRLQIVDQQGQPVSGSRITGLSPRGYSPATEAAEQIAHSFSSDEIRPIIVHHQERNIGRALLAGPQQRAQGQIQVRLLPCATISGRLVDEDTPLTGIVIEPHLLPSGDFGTRLPSVTTGADGRFTCTLPSGCSYRLHSEGSGLDLYATVADEVTPEPGQKIDLGTLRLGPDRRFVHLESDRRPSQDDGAQNGKMRLPAAVEPSTQLVSDAKASKAKGSKLDGRLAGADGQPAANAYVAVVGVIPSDGWPIGRVLAQGLTDAGGHYQLTLSDVAPLLPGRTNVVARTEDSAVAWQTLDPSVKSATVNLTLKPQQLIQVRLVDIQGQPAANLPISLTAISTAPADGQPARRVSYYHLDPATEAWPHQFQTDPDGLLTISNIAAGHGVYIQVSGSEQFATQSIALNTGQPEQRGERDGTYRSLIKNLKPGEIATLPLAPAQFFEGTVLLGDGDQPASNARITMWASQQEAGGSMIAIEGKTNAKGQFRLNPYPGVRFGIIAYPPSGSPHQVKRVNDLRWESGDASKNIEVRLPAGVLAHGTIVDADSGSPVVGASVQYHPEELHNEYVTDGVVTGWQGIQKTDAQGRFKLTVLPGPGTLLIHGTKGEYVLQEVGSRQLRRGQPGGYRVYAHAFHKIDPAVGETLEPIQIRLTPGKTVRGTVVDEAGKPVDAALYMSRLNIYPSASQWRAFAEKALGGRFQLGGLSDGQQVPVYFLDAHRELGGTAMIGSAEKSPKVVLRQCGEASATFVNPDDGKPIVGHHAHLNIVVTPGKSRFDRQAFRDGELVADEDFAVNMMEQSSQHDSVTDQQGHVTFHALIPGALYRMTLFDDGKPRVVSEFVAESGKTHEMGKIELRLGE